MSLRAVWATQVISRPALHSETLSQKEQKQKQKQNKQMQRLNSIPVCTRVCVVRVLYMCVCACVLSHLDVFFSLYNHSLMDS